MPVRNAGARNWRGGAKLARRVKLRFGGAPTRGAKLLNKTQFGRKGRSCLLKGILTLRVWVCHPLVTSPFGGFNPCGVSHMCLET